MLDEDFKMLKRSAIMVQPKQPFIDWVNGLYPIAHEILPLPGELYLIPVYDTEEEIERWLKRNFKELFEEQLFNWHTEEADWPAQRTFKVFGEWFEIKLIPTVWDTQNGFIEKS